MVFNHETLCNANARHSSYIKNWSLFYSSISNNRINQKPAEILGFGYFLVLLYQYDSKAEYIFLNCELSGVGRKFRKWSQINNNKIIYFSYSEFH